MCSSSTTCWLNRLSCCSRPSSTQDDCKGTKWAKRRWHCAAKRQQHSPLVLQHEPAYEVGFFEGGWCVSWLSKVSPIWVRLLARCNFLSHDSINCLSMFVLAKSCPSYSYSPPNLNRAIDHHKLKVKVTASLARPQRRLFLSCTNMQPKQ